MTAGIRSKPTRRLGSWRRARDQVLPGALTLETCAGELQLPLGKAAVHEHRYAQTTLEFCTDQHCVYLGTLNAEPRGLARVVDEDESLECQLRCEGAVRVTG